MELFLYHAGWLIVSFIVVYWMMNRSETVLVATIAGIMLAIGTKSVVPLYLGIWFVPLGVGYIIQAVLGGIVSDK